ncbi:uncharacterized protein LOC113203540 isoform X2 [Frankliniella occidentalis]|uniref:Uncharacterized protein LOC113203540 isoform X2 n=1 Tax=Frankliniella occidentalis TaxID=133901 RepID=A0A6J1RZ52_FRAOC|nr:uncharacterized protein LOC113203540 isoform X2 [Frankliniella occidentalis]
MSRIAVLMATVTVAALHAARSEKLIPSFAGPFDVWIERIDPCDEDDKRVQLKCSHYNPNKKFEPQVWNGFVNLTRALDDTWWIRAPFSIRSNNQWKQNAIVLTAQRNGCSGARNVLPPDLRRFTTKRGTPCSFKEGVSYFRNTSVKFEFPKFPQLPYGHYRVELEAGQQDEKKAEYCFKTIGHVIPKV